MLEYCILELIIRGIITGIASSTAARATSIILNKIESNNPEIRKRLEKIADDLDPIIKRILDSSEYSLEEIVRNPKLLKTYTDLIIEESKGNPAIVRNTSNFRKSLSPSELLDLCRFLTSQGLYDDAIKFYESYEKSFDDDTLISIFFIADLGQLYMSIGLFDSAEDKLNKALKLSKEIPQEKLENRKREYMIAGGHAILSSLYDLKGDLPRAITELKNATAIIPSDSIENLQFLNNLTAIYFRADMMREGELVLEKLKSYYAQKEYQIHDRFYVLFLQNTASLYLKNKQYDLSESKFLEAEKLADKLRKKNEYSLNIYARLLKTIGIFYTNKVPPQFDTAVEYLNSALQIFETIFSNDKQHPEIIETKTILYYSNLNKSSTLMFRIKL